MVIQARVSVNRQSVTVSAALNKRGFFLGILLGELGGAPFAAGSWKYKILRVWRILVSQWLPPR